MSKQHSEKMQDLASPALSREIITAFPLLMRVQ